MQDVDYLLVKFADTSLTWRDKISELGLIQYGVTFFKIQWFTSIEIGIPGIGIIYIAIYWVKILDFHCSGSQTQKLKSILVGYNTARLLFWQMIKDHGYLI
ncbi:MAG: hypothetical protein NTV15_03855 [Candidatus Bathyarchaeota archaeon]|nr:hypothetical protein [Candidatus Bathyarchaeota archaeon]